MTELFSAIADTSGEINIEISDNGSGMSDEALEQVVGTGQKVGQVKITKLSGTGLGLPLVKLLAELHGGRLNMTRGKTAGIVATLRFPSYRVMKTTTAPLKL